MGILGGIFNLLLGSGQNAPRPSQPGGSGPSVSPFGQRQQCFCKYCGMDFPDVRTLTANWCQNHPAGKSGFRHELYEGGAKPQYTCKFCGMTYRNLRDLTRNNCQRNPAGKGKCHEPAL